MSEHKWLTEELVAYLERNHGYGWGVRHLIADWRKMQAELTRLRGIETAIRKCPTTILQHTGIETLIYTTELRDALEAE